MATAEAPAKTKATRSKKGKGASAKNQADNADSKATDADDIKAITMYDMIHTVEIPTRMEKYRVLRATHRQAVLMTENTTSLARLADEFCLRTPHMVFCLLVSDFDVAADSPKHDNRDPIPERQQQLQMFMQRVVLPIAEEANALVICDARKGYCALTTAFMTAYAMRKPAWGTELPVTVVGFAEFDEDKTDQLPEHWQDLFHHLDGLEADGRGNDHQDHSLSTGKDLHAGIPNLVLTGKMSASSKSNRSSQHDSKTDNKSLRAELLSYFNSQMPCVAFKAGSCELSGAKGYDASLRPAVEAVQRGIVVLLVDMVVREEGRKDSVKKEAVKKEAVKKEAVKKEAVKKEAVKLEIVTQDTQEPAVPQQVDTVQSENVKDHSVPEKAAVKDDSTQGKKRAVLQRADSLKILVKEAERQEELLEMNQRNMRGCQDNLKNALECVREFSVPVTGFDVCELAYTLELYERHSPRRIDAFMPLWIQLEISEANRDDLVSLNFRESHQMREDFKKLGQRIRQVATTDKKIASFASSALSLATSTGLAKPINVHWPEHKLDDAVRDVAEQGRLPEGNSTEALRLLREAWNEHDVAAGAAKFYGRMGRLLYFLQLSLNAASVIVVVLLEQFEWQTLDVDQVLFAIAMLSTCLISIIGFANPVARWQRLRAAATQLESTIWQFRTRCGPFQVQVFSYDSDLEEKGLEAQLIAWRKAAVNETDLQRSDFQKTYPTSWYKHGQVEAKNWHKQLQVEERTSCICRPWLRRCLWRKKLSEEEKAYQKMSPSEKFFHKLDSDHKLGADDHHSPLKPKGYVELRLQKMIKFYQKRLPQYARYNRVLFLTSLCSVVMSSVLAFYNLTQWVIVGTALSSASSAWAEFNNVQQNIQRYSDTVLALKNVESWWNSLNLIEKAAIANVEHLVRSTEDIITSECEAWARAQKQQEIKVAKLLTSPKVQPKAARK